MRHVVKILFILIILQEYSFSQERAKNKEIVFSIYDSLTSEVVQDAKIYYINKLGNEIDITNSRNYDYFINDTFSDSNSIFIKITAKWYISGYFIINPRKFVQTASHHYFSLYLTNLTNYSNYEETKLGALVFKNEKYSYLSDDLKCNVFEIINTLEENPEIGILITPYYVSDEPSEELCEYALNNAQLVYNFIIIHLSNIERVKINKPKFENSKDNLFLKGKTYFKYDPFTINKH